MRVTLTIEQLKKLVKEVTASCRGTDDRFLQDTIETCLYDRILVNEMAFPKGVYEKKVLGLGIQLVDNWCLCKWCQLYSPDNRNFRHWARELTTHIRTVQSWDIKGRADKRKILERLLVEYCDYDKADKIAAIVQSKFDDEQIADESQRADVAAKFAADIMEIIGLLSDSSIDASVYAQKTFGLPESIS